MVLSALSLSPNGRDHRPAIGLDAVNTFMIARNARASLIGRVVAFCSEKSCRPTFAPGAAVASRPRSTENDRQRADVGLEVGVHLWVRVREPHDGRVHGGPGEDPSSEPRRQR